MYVEDINWSRLFEENDGSHSFDGEKYQILSYIQSNGTQAIKLMDSVSPTASISVAFEYTENVDFMWIVGGEGAGSKYFGIQISSASSSVNRITSFRKSEARFAGAIPYKNRTIYAAINGSAASVSYTSESKSVDSSFEVMSGFYAFAIGRINSSAEASGMISAKLHTIRVDNELFLPVKRISDNALGLLNTTTHQFLTDALDGDPFVAGDIVGHISVEVDDTDASSVVGTAIVGKSTTDEE